MSWMHGLKQTCRTFCNSRIAFDTGTVSEFNDAGKK